jgi:hypothetical protein
LGKPYKYHLRPGYGSNELLLEFLLDRTDSEFEHDLFISLQNINPRVDKVNDLWMNDEILLYVSSDKGAFTFSRDIWDFAFITAENNQPCIELIDEMLNSSNLFEKIEVDFENYKKL